MTTNPSNAPEREANRLTLFWQKFGPNTYPIDIDALVSGTFNGDGFQGSLSTRLERFDSFEGCLVKTSGTDDWTILLNSRTPNKRRLRFTYAHELGHFMCHRHLRDRFEDSEATLNDFHSDVEREANIFASSLLMPANLFRDEFSADPWTTELLCAIGSRFECSLQASALRYINLTSKPCAFIVSRDGMIVWSSKSKTSPFLRAFKFGDELPELSYAKNPPPSEVAITDSVQTGYSWSESQCCKESQYFDYSGNGFQYTCVEFTG
ncbi:ImmA/IrrE family metallo-endopeptidase [Gemmobacter serpentinus]|uniref:ImmA/IrrE family metallo-endopeptidase n=1 Tax=Gemmobacter serpentinus TaxID=2652247 RepID=UPI00124BFF95